MRAVALATVITMVPLAIMLTAAPTLSKPRIDRMALDYVLTAGIVESGTTVGIADSDLWALSTPDGKLDTAAVNRHLDEMQALGVNTVRIVLPWRGNEPFRPGTFPPGVEEAAWARSDFIVNAAADRGMAIVAVLAHGPDWAGVDPNTDWSLIGFEEPPQPDLFGEYAGRVATRYGEKIAAYEIWNEPNYVRAWAPTIDPAAYTEMLQAAYTAIKDANGDDPNDPLVVAGVLGAVISSPVTLDPVAFVETMYASGAKGYFDALSFHPYHYTLKFSEGVKNDFWRSPLEQLIEMRQLMLDNGDKDLKIWATEYGLPTFGDSGVTEEQQAEFIEDFLNAWKDLKDADGTSYTGPSFIYTLRDRLVNGVLTPNTSLGIFNVDWTAKLAAQVIKDFIEANPQEPEEPEEPEEPQEPGLPNLGEQIAQVLQAFFQVVANAVQGLFNAVATFVNSVAQAIANIFSPGGAAAASLPPEVQDEVAAGADMAAMSWRAASAERDADESEESAAETVSSDTSEEAGTEETTTAELVESVESVESVEAEEAETAVAEETEAAVIEEEQVPAEEPEPVDADVETDVDADEVAETDETVTEDAAEDDSREPVRTGLVARPGQVGTDDADDTDSDNSDSDDTDQAGATEDTGDDDGSSRGGPKSGSEAA
ncbi:cellulase family glycosylhydrolase [Mycolicibacterium pulveris]|uniref:cellulase family glycosylhydrolase n=1 Tax=Mycolicibacterium pulveris TaxID=36813 RepID=UPI003CF8E4D5